MPGSTHQPAEWAQMSAREKVRFVLDNLMDEGDLNATAHAVEAYVRAKYGWQAVVYEPGSVEFGVEGIGPAGYGKADTTAEAICLAALNALGVRSTESVNQQNGKLFCGRSQRSLALRMSPPR